MFRLSRLLDAIKTKHYLFFRGNALTVIPHRKPVYGLTVNPQKDDIIATAGEDGRLLLYDIREAPNQGDCTR